jgi:hypothetical protein
MIDLTKGKINEIGIFIPDDDIPESEKKFDDPNDPENKKRMDEKVKYFEEHPDEIPDL